MCEQLKIKLINSPKTTMISFLILLGNEERVYSLFMQESLYEFRPPLLEDLLIASDTRNEDAVGKDKEIYTKDLD